MCSFLQQFQIWLRNSFKGFLSAAFWAVVASTAATAKSETLPVILDDFGRITVPIELYGRMEIRHFVLDTAARRSLLLNKDSGALGVKHYNKGVLHHFSSEGMLRLPAARIEAWMVGDRMVEGSVVGLYRDNASAEGLLGIEAFRGWIVHWNPATKNLKTYSNAGPLSAAQWHNLGGTPNRHFNMILTTEYGGMDLNVIVATGTDKTLLDKGTAIKLFPDLKAWAEGNNVYRSTVRGLGFQRKNYPSIKLPGFKIGKWDIGDIVVLAAELDAKQITGHENAPVLILGSDILAKHEVAFDFREFQLWYHDPEALMTAEGAAPPTQ